MPQKMNVRKVGKIIDFFENISKGSLKTALIETKGLNSTTDVQISDPCRVTATVIGLKIKNVQDWTNGGEHDRSMTRE
jgi:hypothetical protein